MSLLRICFLVLVLVASSGCIGTKYQGVEEIVAANPKGWDDAVNGSYYRDSGDDSERMMRSLARYINQLEEKLESER